MPNATQTLQYEFAAHIRDPEGNPCPAGLADRRMKVYRELFYNNIEGFIARGFPALRKLIADESWHAMVRDFMVRHRCKTPYFPEIVDEFLEYLQLEREPVDSDLPFMIELAHYDWVELTLAISIEALLPALSVEQLQGEVKAECGAELECMANDAQVVSEERLNERVAAKLLSSVPHLSPLALNLTYQWPVHKLSPRYQPSEPPATPTFLLVYRNRSDKIGFTEMNPVTARLVSLIKEAPKPLQQLLDMIAVELNGVVDKEAVMRGGLETIKGLIENESVYIKC